MERALSNLVPLFPWTSPLEPVYRCEFLQESNVAEFCSAFMKFEGVEHAEPNYLGESYHIPNDSLYAAEWAPSKIQAPSAWNLNKLL